jgi:hypothetical protein
VSLKKWFCTKVFAAWQWYNYVEQQIEGNADLLRVNLDETSVCMYLGGRKGNVFMSRSEPAVEHVRLGQRRAYMTHVAMICDNASVQPHLPQILIANERTLPLRMFADIRSRLPANVLLLRRSSAWNTSTLCAAIVRRLAAALAVHAARYQAVLLLDVHKCHLGAAMLAACRARGIWPLFVPPKVTWLLQPLDVYTFHQFKLFLVRDCLRARIRSRDSAAYDVPRLVDCLCNAIRCVLEGRSWAYAFDRCGFGQHQAALGERVRSALQISGVPPISDAQPTREQFQCCFPKRVVAPVACLAAPRELPTARAVAPLSDAAAVASSPLHPPMYPRRSARLAAMLAAPPPPPERADASAAPAVSAPAACSVWAMRLRRRRSS